MPSSLPALTERDEALLTTFLNASFELPSTARHHQMSLQSLMDWWLQPHIKAAIETLTEMAKARAVFIAANDATHAITALQSCTVLADADFYEQADPKTRHKAFESARKAATTVLRLAGLPRPRASRASTRGSARAMPPTRESGGAAVRTQVAANDGLGPPWGK